MSKILIIEDDPLVQRMYQKALTYEGFTVDTAPDGAKGTEKAKFGKPDLVLLDVMMPRMNGIEVLEALKSDTNTSSIPIIMLTNLSGTQDAQTALNKGAVAYLVKSEYKPKEVAAKVSEVLGQNKTTNSK